MFGHDVSNQRRRSYRRPRRPGRYASSHSNPVTGSLDQVWSSVLFDASSRCKVPGTNNNLTDDYTRCDICG